MGWTHVDRADVNNVDIFSFINLKSNVVITGRVNVGSDLKTQVLVMDNTGVIQGVIPLPDWAFYSTEDALLKAFYEEVDAMPGGDYQNKIWSMMNGKYSPELYCKMVARLSTIAFETPEAVILKYVPDLTITDDMLEQFQF